MTLLLKPSSHWFFTYYREKAIAIGIGMPLKDIFLGILSRRTASCLAGAYSITFDGAGNAWVVG